MLALMLVISLGLHAAFAWLAATVFRAPSLDIEFQVPIDLELGLAEEVAAFAPGESAQEPQEADTKPAEASTSGDQPAPKPKKPKKPRKPAHDEAGAKLPKGPPLAPGETAPGARIPPGAQIAVRVDMARIRQSAVSEDIRALLAAVPDWKALLDGSGIDPVAQLDRLLIATPNLQREKIVIAGRFVGDPAVVDEAVSKLAQAKGVAAAWRSEGGVRVAPWENVDDTQRVIALVGPSHFTISRAEDLPRVLAIAAARAADGDAGVAEHPADALLSMEPDEGLSVEVDGVAQFVRKAKRGIPTKLRLAAVEVPGPRVELRGRMTFASADEATDAADYWAAVRDKYAQNTMVFLLGLANPLRQGKIEAKDAELDFAITLDVQQARLIIGSLRELVTPVPAATPAPAPAPAAP